MFFGPNSSRSSHIASTEVKQGVAKIKIWQTKLSRFFQEGFWSNPAYKGHLDMATVGAIKPIKITKVSEQDKAKSGASNRDDKHGGSDPNPPKEQ